MLSGLFGSDRARATDTPPLIPAQVRIGTVPGFTSDMSDLIFTGNAMARYRAMIERRVMATNKLINNG